MNTIAQKLKLRLEKIIETSKTQKLVKLSDYQNLKKQIEKGQQSVKTLDQLTHLHPIHAIYVSVQNMISYIVEQLSELPELETYCNIIIKAQDLFMPDNLPIQRLSLSYFSSWAFFDVQFGKDKETMGTIIQYISSDLELPSEYLDIIQIMQESCMGIYEHKGNDNNIVHLCELFTNKEFKCHSTSEYLGNKNELWYVRILPPLYNYCSESIAFTTPYILAPNNKKQWLMLIEKGIQSLHITNPIEGYKAFMKYGLKKYYWHEFIFKTYFQSRFDHVLLGGFPTSPKI